MRHIFSRHAGRSNDPFVASRHSSHPAVAKALTRSGLCLLVLCVLGSCARVPAEVSLRTPTFDQPASARECHTGSVGHMVTNHAKSEAIGLDLRRLRMMNWNVWKGRHPRWESEFRRLSLSQDLITLQEARLSDGLQELIKNRQLSWDLAIGFAWKGSDTGVMTLSRVASAFACAQRIMEPWIGLPKSALVTRYPLRDSPHSLLVANVHAVNFTVGIADFRDQMSRLAAVLEAHQGPLILAGDFNTWNSRRDALLSRELRDKLGLKAVGFAAENLTSAFGIPLDRVHYRGLKVIEFGALPATTSDHTPMFVVFEGLLEELS